ncbi:hypothetical protein [Rufibacter hautae]|uniref:Uncharacterized protein n=1 Tax=Rufibacter hautae TaxID=2595005 RepID=A0A5B6TCB7_9BACT|nr:hypothetical protein [Rufibacter hautae]KAA3436743.1 hypothetical protein FOA19_20405 [Rufibacter hautae]
MNKQLKDAVLAIDRVAMEKASQNNLRLMYANDTDYKVRKGDALYIISDNKLQRLEMDTIELIGWHEMEGYSIEDMSSVNYYHHKKFNRLVICEMSYQVGCCLAYFSDKKTTEVSDLVKGHKQHFLDVALIRKLRINSVLE